MRLARFAIVVASALSLHCAVFAAPVPVKDLFRASNYLFGSMSMSPDGSTLVTVYPVEWEKSYFNALAALNLDTKQSKILHLNRDIPVERAEWVGPNRLLVSTWGINSNDNWAPQVGMFSFDVDGGRPVEIVKPGDPSPLFPMAIVDGSIEARRFRFAFLVPKVISRQSVVGDEVLLAGQKIGDQHEKARKWINDGAAPLPGVYKLNVITGEYSLYAPDPGWSQEWRVDSDGKVRIAAGFDRAGFKELGRLNDPKQFPAIRVFWIGDDGKAEPITAIQLGREEQFAALGFAPGGKRFLFAGRQGRDKAAIYAYDPIAKTVTGPLIENANVDITMEEPILSAHDNTVAGVVVHDGLPQVLWLDPKLKALQASIDGALPGYYNRIVDWTRDYQRILILSASAQDPGAYYLLDRKKNSLAQVYQLADWLRGAKFGETRPVSLSARDGVPLHGYLTRPPGLGKGVATPLVLLVHGGPWEIRDYAVFDPEVQFYATRGYSVLQINFRRSAGYGRKFEELGRKQLGRAMQTDLDDAVDWAVAQGIADPKRLLIAGGSYGGYAALMGLVQHPERFQAGIAMFPLTDLIQQAKDLEDTSKEVKDLTYAAFNLEEFKKNVGDPVADQALLEENSPNHQVARIKTPVFLVYGPKDEIIDKQQVRKFIGRMKAQKKTLVHFAPHEEGHGIWDEDRRLQIYTALEKFLQKYAPAN